MQTNANATSLFLKKIFEVLKNDANVVIFFILWSKCRQHSKQLLVKIAFYKKEYRLYEEFSLNLWGDIRNFIVQVCLNLRPLLLYLHKSYGHEKRAYFYGFTICKYITCPTFLFLWHG